VTPIHAAIEDRALVGVVDEMAQDLCQEYGKFGLSHLARRHRELFVPHLAEAGDIPVDPHVVGRIGEDARRALTPSRSA
jgi:hypothetical protein